jgi:hypothetical protein
MKRAKLTALLLLGVALLAPLATLAMPEPAKSTRTGFEFDFYMYTGVSITLVFVVAAIVFFMGLRGFSAKLKRAYTILCSGLIFYGIALVQVPIMTVTNSLDSPWSRSGIIAFPFLLAIIAMYWGITAFAKLFGVRSKWMSGWLVVSLSVLAAVVSVFVPHFGEASEEIAFDSTVAFSVWGLGLLAASVIIALKAKRLANVTYTNALAWMFLGFLSVWVIGVHYLVSIILVGDRSQYAEGVLSLSPYVVSALLFTRAAYSFNAIAWLPATTDASPRTFFGKPKKTATAVQHSISSIDIVTYAAQLVSNPHEIDPILDGLRTITATLPVGSQLSAEQNRSLQNIYLQIEDHLVQKEQVRTFTKEQVRAEMSQKLGLATNSASTFWPIIATPAAPAASPAGPQPTPQAPIAPTPAAPSS